MVGKIIDMANPANDTQIQMPPSYTAYDEKNNPTNDKINKVQYIVIILTGLQNLTRIIPINRPQPKEAQYIEVANDP
jgi:hypothetical protein